MLHTQSGPTSIYATFQIPVLHFGFMVEIQIQTVIEVSENFGVSCCTF